MKRIFIAMLCLALLSTGRMNAQRATRDSLLQVIEQNRTDSAVVHAYLEWGSAFYPAKPDSAVLVWDLAVQRGEKGRDPEQPRSPEDSAVVMYMASSLNNAGYLVAYAGDTARAIAMHNRAIRLYRTLRNEEGMGFAYQNLGMLYTRIGQPMKALQYLRMALSFRRDPDQLQQKLMTLTSMAKAYERLGDARQAFAIYNEALLQYEASGNASGAANLLSNMGVLYAQQGEQGKALAHYKRSYALRDSIGEQLGAAYSLANMGAAYSELKQYDSAVSSLETCLRILESYGDPGLEQNVYNNLGNAHEHMGETEQAEAEYLRALKIAARTGRNNGQVYALINLSGLNFRRGDHAEALRFGEKALQLAQQGNLTDGVKRSAALLSEIYADRKDWSRAYARLLTFNTARDSLLSRENRRATDVQETQYAYEKQHYADSLVNEAVREADQREIDFLANQSDVRGDLLIAMLVILGLVTILLGLLWGVFRTARRTNAEIAAREQEKDLLLREIHHRVKNNLQIITGLLELQALEANEEAFSALMQEGQSRVKSMALIHEKLYQEDRLAEIDMQDYTERLIEGIGASFRQGSQQIDAEIACAGIRLDIDTAIPLGLILNELLTNSYKYAFAGLAAGKVQIRLEKREGGGYALHYADDGPGLPDGMDFRKGKSLGMRLIRRLTAQLSGEIEYLGTPGRACAFRIRFEDTDHRKQRD